MEAVCQCVTCVSSVDFFAPALPAQLFLSQHFCVFAPVFLGHSLAVWVALALPNMPPKARAPEARMVFGWGQVSGVEICTCSGPSRCLPTVCKKLRKECLYIYIYIFFFPPLGFAHALCCNQKASHAVLGNLERSSCVHRCFDRTHQASASKLTLISTSPKSLLTDGDPRACCLELTTNFQSGSK